MDMDIQRFVAGCPIMLGVQGRRIIIYPFKTVEDLTKSKDQTVAFKELFSNYSIIRRFLPKLLSTLKFLATPAAQPALLALNFLASRESKTGKNKYINAPLDSITPSWRNIVVKDSTNKINSCAYTF
jgi:hypothetical protein